MALLGPYDSIFATIARAARLAADRGASPSNDLRPRTCTPPTIVDAGRRPATLDRLWPWMTARVRRLEPDAVRASDAATTSPASTCTTRSTGRPATRPLGDLSVDGAHPVAGRPRPDRGLARWISTCVRSWRRSRRSMRPAASSRRCPDAASGRRWRLRRINGWSPDVPAEATSRCGRSGIATTRASTGRLHDESDAAHAASAVAQSHATCAMGWHTGRLMPLEDYRRKRDFGKTPEPPPDLTTAGDRSVGPVRRPAPPRDPAALRLPAGDRRRPRQLGRAQGPDPRPEDAAHGRPRRGPPDRVLRLRGRHPGQAVRRRRRHRLGLGHVGAGGADARRPPGASATAS